MLKLVFHAHVQSHIAYGLCVYGGTSKKNLMRILLLQKKALRTMLKLKQNESVKQLFAEHEILTVFSLYIYQCIMHVKNSHTQFPVHARNHLYNTRSKNDLVLPKPNLECYKNKVSYAGCTFFNNLPKNIKDISDEKKFKLELKKYLLKHPFYSIEEFFL